MKLLCTACIVICMFISQNVRCQQVSSLNQYSSKKISLFKSLPEKISCSAISLQNIFTAPVNSNVSIAIDSSLKLKGTVLAKSAISPDLLSINIHCNNFRDALLNVSRVTEVNSSFSFIGKMIVPNQEDVYLLWQENGEYFFIKQKQLLSMVQ